MDVCDGLQQVVTRVAHATEGQAEEELWGVDVGSSVDCPGGRRVLQEADPTQAKITGPRNPLDLQRFHDPHSEDFDWQHTMGLADSDDMYAHGFGGCWGGSDGLTSWLNRDDVRAAIHVVSQQDMKDMYGDSPRSYLWRDCGMKNVDYERGATSSLLPRFPALIERYHVLIFSGDVDACVPYIGTQSWTADVARDNGCKFTSDLPLLLMMSRPS
jgi:hypothetical protein